jgi:hypothetical protein
MNRSSAGPDELPEDLRRLLESHLDSYESLVVVMLMQENRGREWTADALVCALPQTEQIAEALNSLQAAGFIRATSAHSGQHYVYAPTTPALDAAVASLVQVYREQPTAVIKFMSANAVRRLRKGALRAFAEVVLRRRR